MPGSYLDYDPVREERLAKRLKAQKKARATGIPQPKGLDDIEEDGLEDEDEAPEPLIPEDEIWHLDDEDDDAAKTQDGTDSEAGGGIDAFTRTKTIVEKKKTPEQQMSVDDRENIADSIV